MAHPSCSYWDRRVLNIRAVIATGKLPQRWFSRMSKKGSLNVLLLNCPKSHWMVLIVTCILQLLPLSKFPCTPFFSKDSIHVNNCDCNLQMYIYNTQAWNPNRKWQRAEKIFEEKMAEDFPYLMEHGNLYIQESQKSTNKSCWKRKNITPTHVIAKPLKIIIENHTQREKLNNIQTKRILYISENFYSKTIKTRRQRNDILKFLRKSVSENWNFMLCKE